MLPAQKLLDTLVEQKALDKAAAERIHTEVVQQGLVLEDYLVKKKLIDESQFAQAKAKILDVPFVTLSGRGISPEIMTFVPEPVARRYLLFPFDLDVAQNTLYVAMEDPFDIQVIEFLEQKTGKRIKTFIALHDDITTTIDDVYTQSLGAEVTAALKETVTSQVRTVEAGKLG